MEKSMIPLDDGTTPDAFRQAYLAAKPTTHRIDLRTSRRDWQIGALRMVASLCFEVVVRTRAEVEELRTAGIPHNRILQLK